MEASELDVERYSRAIDPHLHIWGWEVPVYLFLGGMAAGLMIASSLLALRGGELSRTARRASLMPLVLVSAGMLSLLLDLEHKLHAFRFYLTLRPSSPMSWGAWILVGVYPVGLLTALSLQDSTDLERVRGWLSRVGLARVLDALLAVARRHARSLLLTNAGLGVGLGVYTGVLLSTLGARPLWSSAVLGPLFLVSGFSTGLAALLLAPIADAERRWAARWDEGAIVAELVLLGLFLIGLLQGSAASRTAGELLMGGAFTASFWSLVVAVGLVAPLALALLAHRSRRPAPLVAPALVLIGGLSLRFILVAAGQAA